MVRSENRTIRHFHERQRSHIGLPGLPTLAALAEATLALTRPGSLGMHLIQWGIVAVFIGFGIMVRELTIQVDAERLTFGFGFVRRTVRLSDITAVRLIDGPAQHLGLGVRSTSDGRMAWIAVRGPAVEIETGHGSSGTPNAYVISTGRPHDLAAALQSGQASRSLDGA